ncbi:MAG: ABC transporter ATP-binding protein [Planctomycetota bacterium]
MIELSLVDMRYPGTDAPAVDALSLRVEAGELVALLGESGCGKTTTLKMINRLIEPTAGSVTIDGQDVRRQDPVTLRRGIGYVFQGIGLLPHYRVDENLAVVPNLLGWDRTRIATRVDALLDLVNLDRDLKTRMPAELSGGQQQRVGVARALAAEPKVMLMDEPFGAIDPINRDALRGEFRAIHDRLGLTTVLVTHDVTEALLLADRVAVMRAGKLVAYNTPAALMAGHDDPYVNRLMQTPRAQAHALEALETAYSTKPSGGVA